MTLFKTKLITLFSLIFLLASCGGSSEMDFVEIKSILLQKKGLIAGIELGESIENVKSKKLNGFVLDDKPINEKHQILRRKYGSDWTNNQVVIGLQTEENKVKYIDAMIFGGLAENRVKLKKFMSEIFNHFDTRFQRIDDKSWEIKKPNGKTIQIRIDSFIIGEELDDQSEQITIQIGEK
tara:strand:+ start:125 stop:664 length:540 start_codon:yes stop_codon:yes gene_type:complete